MSATPVNPMRNAAPGQQQQSGADTQKLGDVTTDIGERIQNQLDNAMAKQAETGFLKNVLDITSGDGTQQNPGYLNLKGQDAINGYTDAATAIAKAKADGASGLADDFQKSMYNRVASQHLLNFGRQMADHRFQQGQQFYTEASVNRSNSYATLASNAPSTYFQVDADGNQTGDFWKYTHVAEQNTLDAVQRSKGAPPGSGQANEALLNLHTQIGVGSLVQMMDAPQDSRPSPAKVQSIYDDMKAKGWLTLQAQDTLGKMVKSFSDSETVPAAAKQSLSDAVRKSQGQPTSSTGTPDYSAAPIKGATVTAQPYDPEAGGVAINVPQGSNIQAPADGKVTQVGKDAEDNYTMKIEHADGSVTAFTGLTASNVKVGDAVSRGENVATSGAADGKTPSVLWSLTNAAGTNVDPTKAGLAPVDVNKITDENVLTSALDSMRKQITDPKLQYQTSQEMIKTVRENQQMQTAAQSQLFKQASDAFYSSGMNWRSIPPSVFNQLPPERQQQFKDLQTETALKNYHQGQAFKEMSETDLVSTFYAHPDVLTPTVVDGVRPQLANSTYLSLMERATALQNNPKGVVEASAIAERVKYFANLAGIKDPDDKQQSQADKQNYTNLMYKVSNDIDTIKTANKGKATSDQVDKAIQQELIQQTISTPRSPWNPLAFLGISPNTSTAVHSFQMPAGATHVVPGSDGKMHYWDGTKDLGVVQ
jgi:hypothetical protein